MLTYHPIFDSNHCLFRILYLLRSLESTAHEIDKIRLFDYYLCAPYSLKLFRTNSKEVKKKRDSILKNLSRYDEIDNSKALFFDARTIQTTVLNYLAAKNIISSMQYSKGFIVLNTDEYLQIVDSAINNHKSIILSVMNLIEEELQVIPVMGVDGLKHRSNLMEYRYDVL